MMPPLFPDMPVRLPMPDADVTFFPAFFNAVESEDFLRRLTAEIPWRQVSIRLYGKTIPVPRLTSWHGDAGTGYAYSHVELIPEPWTPALSEIRERLLAPDGLPFNSVLLNYYRDGSDGVSWHSDDEPELGPAPVIASVSFGAVRRFQFRHRVRRTEKTAIDLTAGSCLLMRGETQRHWQHQIPKTKKPCGPRINLTFRRIETNNRP
ncbi:alpha-ketoglutarate-dependent dioxygenase AlkB family protein [Zavarzinella formosa]|uniref:alpha-ketoglutarate-dependent dioxygenase AlkB family protein n=1 Tax=Zavarzinella formosa TaxID=360055 RepID=UPI0002D8D59C|nr:alpha-ketoglutarate-dependent dioxygenase AlkB [Zavarzinella formosa]